MAKHDQTVDGDILNKTTGIRCATVYISLNIYNNVYISKYSVSRFYLVPSRQTSIQNTLFNPLNGMSVYHCGFKYIKNIHIAEGRN